MLTGIMVLFEVALALTGQSLVDERSELEGYQDVVKSSDRLFQRMLTDPQDLQSIGPGRYGSGLCRQIICRIQGINCGSGNKRNPLYAGLDYSEGALDYRTPGFAPAVGLWDSSCNLERWIDCDASLDPSCEKAELIHRVLIRPDRERLGAGYELYSCIVARKSPAPRCMFERGA